MQYDPIKRSLGRVFNLHPWLRVLFYNLLDLLLLRSWYIRRELRKWRKIARPDAKILDAGSGFGQYVWRIARIGSGYSIKGIDIKDEQVADCNDFFRKRGLGSRVIFECATLEDFNEKDNYDMILSVDVMEHIEEDERVMKNLCDALRKGGMLLISTPSDKGGSDVHHHDSDGAVGFIDEHVRDGYNADDIRQKLEMRGEDITISSIEKKVKDDYNLLKGKFSDIGKKKVTTDPVQSRMDRMNKTDKSILIVAAVIGCLVLFRKVAGHWAFSHFTVGTPFFNFTFIPFPMILSLIASIVLFIMGFKAQGTSRNVLLVAASVLMAIVLVKFLGTLAFTPWIFTMF
jgi:SAM-dependent methyltransferase